MSYIRSIYKNKRLRALLGSFLLSLLFTVTAIPALSQVPSPLSIQALSTQAPTIQELVDQGRNFYTAGQIENAIASWQQALDTYIAQADKLHQAMVLSYLALAYSKVGQQSQATESIATALNLLNSGFNPGFNAVNSGSEQSTERAAIFAQVLTTRGHLEYSQGNLERALETWQQATALYQQLKDTTGIEGSLINQAQALEILGFHYRACQTLLEALNLNSTCDIQTLQDVEPIVQAFTNKSELGIQWIGLHSFGNVLRSIGYFSQSEQVLRQSLQLAQQLQSPHDIAATWLSLGNTQRALYTQAVDLYERSQLKNDRQIVESYSKIALESYQTASQVISSASDHFSFSDTLRFQIGVQRLGLLLGWQQWLTHQAEDNAALQTDLQTQIQAQISELLNLDSTKLPANRATAYAQLEFARLLAKVNLDAAFQQANDALSQALALQDIRTQSYAQGTLGYLYETVALSHQPTAWQSAQSFTEAALLLAQSIQAQEITHQWQWQLGRIYRAQEKNAIAIDYYNAAVDTLNVVRRDLVATSVDVQFSFRDNIEPIYRELVQLLVDQAESAAEPSNETLKRIVEQTDVLRLTELEDFLRCDLTQTVEISEKDIDPTAAVLYPIILNDQLAVILKLPKSDQFHLHTIRLPKQAIEQTVRQLRYELEQRYRTPTGLSLSKQIYTWLVQPVESLLQQNQIKTLVFVPDGSLRNIPMAALHNGQRYLIADYAVAISPGLELLQPEPLSQLRLRVLSFGLSETRQDFPPHQGFASLTNVETELGAIQSSIPSRVLLNQDFTGSSLQNLVRSVPFPVIHLATHGQFSSNPQDTFILSWDQRITIDNLSSILQKRDRTNSTPIELLVLSACKTADGDSRATLGLAGIAIQSGVRSTIASLWYMDDRATANLMSYLYQELSNQQTPVAKAEALRQAQLALLQTEGYQAPLYWAAYVLVGNWL